MRSTSFQMKIRPQPMVENYGQKSVDQALPTRSDSRRQPTPSAVCTRSSLMRKHMRASSWPTFPTPRNSTSQIRRRYKHCCGTGFRILKSSIARSEEHTSELQSRFDLVCRLLLE